MLSKMTKIVLKRIKKQKSTNLKLIYLLVVIMLLVTIYQIENYPASLDQPTLNKKQLFCLVITHKNSFETKAKVMYNAWVKNCDKHFFIATVPNGYKPAKHQNPSDGIELIYNSSFTLLQPPDYKVDNYKILTDKVYQTLKYLYKNYNDYEYYLKCDDDTFIFVDNLRQFLSEKNSSKELVTYGYDYKTIVERGYHSGGAGKKNILTIMKLYLP
jgi:hypothetical protein